MALTKKQRITRLFERFREHNPAPKTELEFASPFQLLIAVMLSAQSTDAAVNKATPGLFALAPDAHSMAALSIAEIKAKINSIGLNNSKAKNVSATAKILRDQFAGEVPRTRCELEALPGVGKKTAGVVMNVVYQSLTLPVDTHVFRLAGRLGLSSAKTPEQTEDVLLKVIPQDFLPYAHHWLILHGRYLCKARKPECSRCFLTDLCPFFTKNHRTSANTP